MSKTAEKVIELSKLGAQIICLQELYRSDYFCDKEDYANFSLAESLSGDSVKLFSPIAKEYKVVIILPIFEKRTHGLYHNSIVVLDADGSVLGVYRKMHIPDDPGFYEKFYFTPGDLGFKVFKTRYGTIGTLICWDQWFPEGARLAALAGAEILFYPTAIGWAVEEKNLQIRQEQIDAWETIQRAHSIANGIFVCTVNRVGIEKNFLQFWGHSFVYGPFGRLKKRLSNNHEEVAIVECELSEIDYYRTHWPFLRDRRVDAYDNILKRFSEV